MNMMYSFDSSFSNALNNFWASVKEDEIFYQKADVIQLGISSAYLITATIPKDKLKDALGLFFKYDSIEEQETGFSVTSSDPSTITDLSRGDFKIGPIQVTVTKQSVESTNYELSPLTESLQSKEKLSLFLSLSNIILSHVIITQNTALIETSSHVPPELEIIGSKVIYFLYKVNIRSFAKKLKCPNIIFMPLIFPNCPLKRFLMPFPFPLM